MNSDVSDKAGVGLLAFLRAATAQAHERLDASFSSLPLASRDGYQRFLAGHAIGWAALWPQLRDFAPSLGAPAPDYPAMLAADLADLGIDAAGLPALDAPPPDSPGATSYVLAGSRMGIATIRRQPNWASANGTAGRYLADDAGPGLFRAVREWMAGPAGAAQDRDAAARSACAAFAVFADAFALSAKVAAPAARTCG